MFKGSHALFDLKLICNKKFTVCVDGLPLLVLGQRCFEDPSFDWRSQPGHDQRGRICLPKREKDQAPHQVQFNNYRLRCGFGENHKYLLE